MLEGKSDPLAFRTDPDCVAVALPAERIFGLLRRSFDVPPGWLALTTRQGGEATMHPQGTAIAAAGVIDLMLARVHPVELEITEDEIQAADACSCTAHVNLRLRVVAELNDLKALRAGLLGSGDRVSRDHLVRHIRGPVREVLAEFARARGAGDLVDGREHEALERRLAKRLEAVLFGHGLALAGSPRASFESEAWRRIRRQQEETLQQEAQQAARQRLQDALTEARRRHLADLEELLGRLQELSRRSPSVSLASLIRTFTESQRGQVYEGLWSLLPSAERTLWLAVVAGDELLCFDPTLPDAPARRVRLDGQAGPLRSVRFWRDSGGEGWLLLGAARGVYEVGVDDLRLRRTYTFELEGKGGLRGGVNAVARWNRHLFATHSEVGLLTWTDDPLQPAACLLSDLTRGARAVRAAQVVDGRLVFTVDKSVIVCPASQVELAQARRFAGGVARITAVHAVGEELFAGDEVGDIWRWRMDDPQSGTCLRRGNGSPIEGLRRIDAGGIPHLVFAERGTPALQAMVIDDVFVCRYEAGEQGIRRCAAAGDLFVGVNDTRDRLVCWKPGRPHEPVAVIPVSAQCGHTIQDVCLVTGEADPVQA